MRQTWKFQVSSWIENSTSCELIAFSRIWILSRRPTTVSEPLPFLEPPNITFYIWPIVCSLSVHNVTAWVRGDNRLERTNVNTTVTNPTTPIISLRVPSDPMVTSWTFVVDEIFSRGLSFPAGFTPRARSSTSLGSGSSRTLQSPRASGALLSRFPDASKGILRQRHASD